MSSHATPRALSFKAGATGIVKGCVVKAGADGKHVLISAAATSNNIGIALGSAASAEDVVEVALSGGGAKGLVGAAATPAFGDLLTANASGALVVTTTPGDRYVAMAMEAGVAGDLISVEVVCGLI